MKKSITSLALSACMAFQFTAVANAAEMSPYMLTPDKNGNVSSVSEVFIAFPRGVTTEVVSTEGITLTCGETVYTVAEDDPYGQSVSLYFDYADATVKEKMTITQPGIYTLHVPAGAFKNSTNGDTNAAIDYSFTITDPSDYSAAITVAPAPGNVESISEITIKFDNSGNKYSLVDEFKTGVWNKITLKRKGAGGETYSALNYTCNNQDMTITLTFAKSGSNEAATITAKGEYLLSIPAEAFCAKHANDYFADANRAFTALYEVADIPTGIKSIQTEEIKAADNSTHRKPI